MKNYGLKFDEFSDKDYFLGGGFLGTTEINPNGDWSGFAPLPEYQNLNGIDPQGCTRFGTNNALEILFSFVLQEDKNFSDRFVCIVDKCGRNGASPQTTIEAIRKIGEIDESLLSFTEDINTLDKYFSPDPMPSYLLDKAKSFLKNYDIGHEWVYPIGTNQTNKQQQAMITRALKRSPVAISVSAWHPDGLGGYDQQWAENHWCVILKEDEVYYHIYDSYENAIKKYDKMSIIQMAKIYTVKRIAVEDQVTTFKRFWNWIMSIVNKEVTTTTVKPIEQITNESDLTIGVFCNAIKDYEGYIEPGKKDRSGKIYPNGSRSYRNCNPGNLKYLNNMYLAIGQDIDGFAKFATYKDGFMALSNKIRNACEGKSTVYFPDDTILQFCQKYAPNYDSNNPDAYAKYLADRLGVDAKTFRLKDLLAV